MAAWTIRKLTMALSTSATRPGTSLPRLVGRFVFRMSVSS